MLDAPTIQAAVDRLAAAASSPCRVILFGSYARDTADEGSDLDLMVIEQEAADTTEYLRLRKAIGRIGTGVDVLVYPLYEFERRSQVPGTVLFEARIEGKVLHDGLAWRSPALPEPGKRRSCCVPNAGGNAPYTSSHRLFHAQQSIEKSLKAVLFAEEIEFRRTHDLYELADHVEQAGVALPCSADELGLLNPYAVDFRYDDQLVPALSKEEVEAMTQGVLACAKALVEKKEGKQ